MAGGGRRCGEEEASDAREETGGERLIRGGEGGRGRRRRRRRGERGGRDRTYGHEALERARVCRVAPSTQRQRQTHGGRAYAYANANEHEYERARVNGNGDEREREDVGEQGKGCAA